jgi:hypothetical protein
MASFAVGGTLPEGLSPFAREVCSVVAKHTVFSWQIVSAQCRRASIDPMQLDKESLRKVAGFIAEGVGAFTSPAKVRLVEEALSILVYSR